MARTLDPAAHALRRETFVDSAQRLITTKGYEEMSIGDVLADTGASKGAFYHYFDSKAALLDAVIERMVDQATVLMEAVKGGAGRESAHAAIKEHALAAAQDLRKGLAPALLERLAADPRLGLTEEALRAALRADERFIGAAMPQVDAFLAETEAILHRLPEARDFRPGRIL